MADDDPHDELDGISDEDAERLLADAVDKNKADDDPEGADHLGEPGRKALDSIKEQRRQARQERDDARRELADLRKKLRGQEVKDKTLQQQLDDLRGEITERDTRDVERQAQIALSQVHTRLAEGGIARADVAGLLEHVDLKALLADGQPDDKAIEKFASSLLKVAGRASPDPDQGRRGGGGPVDMNTLIRRAAGVIT